MDYMKLIRILGIISSCFVLAKGGHVQFNTTRTTYNVGDTVTLTCYVRSGWLTVSLGRNNLDLGWCSSSIKGCVSPADIRDKHGNYELKLEKSRPMLVIKNVSIDDAGADFTCHWTTYTATLSFAVTDEPVQFKTTYNIGNTVALACYVRSSWQTVSFRRNNVNLGLCSTIINGCVLSADIRDKHGNYELKLEKSRPMLVIKNVDKDDDGADFTCQWTSYTATKSFAVTAVTIPSVHEEKLSDSSVVLEVVVLSLIVIVIVQAILILLRVKLPASYCRRVANFKKWLGQIMHKDKYAENTDSVRTSGKRQELQKGRTQLGGYKDETKTLLTQGDLESKESRQLENASYRRKNVKSKRKSKTV